ncbi:hypothetical protein GCM10010339_63150 [Streptomyces alanosinicus]|uniref:Uncharacterized protein n=1 Tax=Streptomyces alanosinicus TaxID=68171 RepID=A0A919D5Y4_9ACTN|nr:hypothetical protein GCM10010339_63150 [Streptomyces alanosinicus]
MSASNDSSVNVSYADGALAAGGDAPFGWLVSVLGGKQPYRAGEDPARIMPPPLVGMFGTYAVHA